MLRRYVDGILRYRLLVIGLTLLWVYLRRHEAFIRFRNTILLANLIGLLGFWLMPTAPPWMFPAEGFVEQRGEVVARGVEAKVVSHVIFRSKMIVSRAAQPTAWRN